MADPHVISALVRKRAEFAGDLIKIDKQRAAVKVRIAHLDETLRMFGYKGSPSEIAPHVCYVRLFRRGELRQMVADILRTANVSPANRAIAVQVVRKRGWNVEDRDLLERIMQSVKASRRSIKLPAANIRPTDD